MELQFIGMDCLLLCSVLCLIPYTRVPWQGICDARSRKIITRQQKYNSNLPPLEITKVKKGQDPYRTRLSDKSRQAVNP
ncbi:hypothetical protein BDV27DRAFT_128859 [Aspergillus caelatus]|uniref:Secreted protein n=2 Tax=Aspergillus subgen. Circumdati TaxID=2720871 RepID=A0A5N7A6N1_9EURO|nr:uncharacterized protein BDV27DRAFT_128859 [Aspergillus caelatus]KAE8364190.1 hypothetical protein BDV27DRAFT_128859 [Aspergillus caelatus]KAE8417775.1 hypothetical protein BDV36DRAFT_255796 [Aspergillus pseudocaelatus]